jgi:hypothetical protein
MAAGWDLVCERSVSPPHFGRLKTTGPGVGNGNSAEHPSSAHMEACGPFGNVLDGCVILVVIVSSFRFTSHLWVLLLL